MAGTRPAKTLEQEIPEFEAKFRAVLHPKPGPEKPGDEPCPSDWPILWRDEARREASIPFLIEVFKKVRKDHITFPQDDVEWNVDEVYDMMVLAGVDELFPFMEQEVCMGFVM